jgi:hypothetical protein
MGLTQNKILVSALNNGAPPSSASITPNADYLHPANLASTGALPPLAPVTTTSPSSVTASGVITQQPSSLSTTPTNNVPSSQSAIAATATATAHFAEVENLVPGGLVLNVKHLFN